MQRTLPTMALAGYLVIAAAFILINILTDRSSFWAIWPIWVAGMITAAIVGQARLAPYRLLGIWIGFGAVLVAGLFALNVRDGGTWWFFWPLGVWVIGTMAIAGLTVNLLDSVPTSHPAIDEPAPRTALDEPSPTIHEANANDHART